MKSFSRFTTLSAIIGLVALSACQPVSAGIETRNPANLPRTLTVSGRGDAAISTTLTQARLGVEVQGKTSQEVQQALAQRSSAVVEFLKSRNVQKLETTGINLTPIYNYRDGRQEIVGYSGSNIVSFRTETEKAGNLLDEAVKAGATRIDSVSFVASEAAIAQAQQQAIREATESARQQAEAALSALNFKAQEIVSIQINGATPPVPPPMPYPAANLAQVAKERADTPIVGAEQQVEASVTLQIRY